MDFEVIPLEEPPPKEKEEEAPPKEDPRMQAASNADMSAWIDAYSKLMGKSIAQFHRLISSKHWNLVPGTNSKINLYRKQSGVFLLLKATAQFTGLRAERLAYVMSDFDPKTRLKWNGERYDLFEQLETFQTDTGPIHYGWSRFKIPIPCVSAHVRAGIFWKGYNADAKVHTFVFRTTQHRYFTCPKGSILVDSLIGIAIRSLSDVHDGVRNCELILVEQVNFTDTVLDWITEMYVEWVRDEISLCERVARNWDTYYKQENKRSI